jgi:hypothetical protein
MTDHTMNRSTDTDNDERNARICRSHAVENFKISGATISINGARLLIAMRLEGANKNGMFGPFIFESAHAGDFIKEILTAVGVRRWDQLAGRYVRGAMEDLNTVGVVAGIGHILDSRWLMVREFCESRSQQ